MNDSIAVKGAVKAQVRDKRQGNGVWAGEVKGQVGVGVKCMRGWTGQPKTLGTDGVWAQVDPLSVQKQMH